MARATATNDEANVTAVEVAGFKSANLPVRVNFRDITVLAGANSAGKSTVMQPLLLIKQTIEKPFDPGGLAIDGPLVRFTHADQLFSHQKQKNSAPVFDVTIERGSRKIALRYGRSDAGSVAIMRMSFGKNDTTYSWTDNQSLKPTDNSLSDDTGEVRFPRDMLRDFSKGQGIRVSRDRVALVANLMPREERPIFGRPPIILAQPAGTSVNLIRKMIYLPGLRGNPERQYVISAAGPDYPGRFDDYVASIIHHWGAIKSDKFGFLEGNLKALGLTSRVTTRTVDDTRVEVHVGRLPAARGGAKDTVNIADVGFGVSQILPVLVALLAADRGQMVFVEQPELHLHPKAQIALADIVLQAADRGVRVVVETHSSLFILGLQAAVAEGRLAPGRISMNWFTRDDTGQTQVAEARLAEDGSYGDWPVDFDTVELNLQDRYMTLVDRRRAQV
jgi:predicted ATPase